MNLIEKMEKEIIEEIKRITEYQEFNWDKVFLDRGDMDFIDNEIEVTLSYESYGNNYTFIYDYESKVGTLHKVDKDGNFVELWSKEKS